MERFNEIIRAPGAKGAIEDTAPTQRVDISRTETDKIPSISPEPVAVENVTGYIAQPKDRLLDRWLDWIVKTSGSEVVFFSLMGALLTWAFMGIPFGQSTDWQVVISDVQAIIGYIFDSLLMRQQSNGYDKLMRVSACLRSRNISNKRMLRAVTRSGTYQKITSMEFEELQQTEFATELPAENWLGQVSTFVSGLLGHISTVCLFWVGILIWIGFGHYCGWSDKWELYINSATSALMMFVFTFLANIRERHSAHTERCLNSLYEVDSALEHKLRTITGDTIPNQTVTIPAPKFSKVQRAIYYYADIVGNLVGIAILIVVMILWVAIGPAMSFNSNWWLLIGTYAGLVGMNDGFVLRNVHSHLKSYEDAEFEKVGFDDMDMFAAIDAPAPKEEYVVDNSFSCRLSIKMGVICSHEITVVLGVILIIGLIIGSSAMRWSITGQLLCNIPPSIIESFFMIILITGHNISSARRRVDLHNIYLRRLKLISGRSGGYLHLFDASRRVLSALWPPFEHLHTINLSTVPPTETEKRRCTSCLMGDEGHMGPFRLFGSVMIDHGSGPKTKMREEFPTEQQHYPSSVPVEQAEWTQGLDPEKTTVGPGSEVILSHGTGRPLHFSHHRPSFVEATLHSALRKSSDSTHRPERYGPGWMR